MDLAEAQGAIFSLLGQVSPGVLPKVIQWLKTSSEIEELTTSNADVLLHNIADDLRNCLPVEAMVISEKQAQENIQRLQKPTLHVDAFLYNDEAIDSLCEEGKMSRNYCTSCGSTKTAPLDFLSHSFSILELKFLFQHALPDLSGKTLLDVGSRLGAVLYAGYVYSSASKLQGIEINAEFCELQEKIITKYHFSDRIQVNHSDICSQKTLLHQADVVVLNNVFEYFLSKEEQIKAWIFMYENLRKKGCLVVTVPSLKESFSKLQINMQLSQWLEEIELDTDIFLGPETDQEALSDIHLYRVL
ncbi:uncharacterized protein LOC122921872 [Bufo gargarizans]|uniref:uncharacterized protein LOC122921872 n=1 Tax=Bufo gargarizans TaxID=30331 RepID=UPI001CF28DC4|nr:uncharacterized protein LOC122921872 [Bufo gargarizans]